MATCLVIDMQEREIDVRRVVKFLMKNMKQLLLEGKILGWKIHLLRIA